MNQTLQDRLGTLERQVEERRSSLDPDPPDDDRAMEIVREGFGPTVSLYCEARTGEQWVRFDDETFDRLEGTMNDWLELYASCYDETLDGTFPIRAAAELLVDTHNARDTAQVLTGVPSR